METQMEIEVRAWDISKKKFHYPKLWDNTMPSNWEQHYEINLYTRLKDVNKKHIYVGDLLKGHDGFIYRVWFVRGGFAINVHVDKFKHDIKMDYPFPLQCLSDEQTVSYIENNCEVIGSIYEHKYLLDNK